MSVPKKGGLGRGLAALLPTGDSQFRDVDIDLISPNPSQPRTQMDPDQLADLAESIREHGVLQPIIVTEQSSPGRPSTYRIIAGERRWQAAKLADMARVPVVIKEASTQQVLEWALVENIQRADLSPLEEAAAYRHLADDFGLTQEMVATRVGRSRSTVANTMRLLRLPDEVKEMIACGELTEGHARALLAIDDPERLLEFARRAVNEGWNVRKLEAETRRPAVKNFPKPPPDPDWRALENRLRDSLGTKVTLARGRKGGRVVIHYADNEILSGILQRLGLIEE